MQQDGIFLKIYERYFYNKIKVNIWICITYKHVASSCNIVWWLKLLEHKIIATNFLCLMFACICAFNIFTCIPE